MDVLFRARWLGRRQSLFIWLFSSMYKVLYLGLGWIWVGGGYIASSFSGEGLFEWGKGGAAGRCGVQFVLSCEPRMFRVCDWVEKWYL